MDLSFNLEKTVPGASLGVWDECVGMKKITLRFKWGLDITEKISNGQLAILGHTN